MTKGATASGNSRANFSDGCAAKRGVSGSAATILKHCRSQEPAEQGLSLAQPGQFFCPDFLVDVSIAMPWQSDIEADLTKYAAASGACDFSARRAATGVAPRLNTRKIARTRRSSFIITPDTKHSRQLFQGGQYDD
jgi:hypothetical protein